MESSALSAVQTQVECLPVDGRFGLQSTYDGSET